MTHPSTSRRMFTVRGADGAAALLSCTLTACRRAGAARTGQTFADARGRGARALSTAVEVRAT